MHEMFRSAGSNATIWNIGNIDNWDVSNVINMSSMFSESGMYADYLLDLRNWNVSNVQYYNDFGNPCKVLSPFPDQQCNN